jgi:hypothetical protein
LGLVDRGYDPGYGTWCIYGMVSQSLVTDGIGVPNGLSKTMRLDGSYQDGTSNTIILAERYSVPNGNPVAWMGDPSYPVFDYTTTVQKNPTLSAANIYNIQSPRAGGILVALADASVRTVAPNVFNNTTWQRACQPADGQTLGSDW